jgi:hypothetical protein
MPKKQEQPFKPMLIAINTHQQREHDTQKSTFLSLVSDFFNEVEQFVTVTDKNEFKGNFFLRFKELFAATYKGKFPEIVTLDKQLELASVNVNKLHFLSEKLNSYTNIQVDLNTNEFKEIDFGLYTTTPDQNKLLEFLNSLCNTIATAETFTNVNKGHIQAAFSHCIFFDHKEQRFRPNYYFITNQMR